jgi:chaperonin cofactor prefoldin
MDETTVNGSANAATDLTAPLTQNDYVQELFAILESNGKEQEMQNTLTALVSWKKQAGKQLDAISEIQNHPMKFALKNVIKTLEVKIEKIKEQLAELRSSIIAVCKNAVAAFKEKGVAALDKLASFGRVKGD